MVTRWTFAGLGAPIHLDDSPAVVHHYGSLFSTSLPELAACVGEYRRLSHPSSTDDAPIAR